MDVKELLDEDSFDPKKLFDEKQYGTLIINREGFSAKQNDAADLVYTLLDKENSRDEKDQIYSKLKELNAGEILLDALKSCEKDDEKIKLLAACWETGIDFSNDLLVFVDFVCHQNFEIAVEALTVAENIESLKSEVVEAAIHALESNKQGNADLKTALLTHLRNLE